MIDTASSYQIFSITFNSDIPSVTISSHWIVIILILLILISVIFLKNRFLKLFNVNLKSLEFEISGSPKLVFKVERNSENLYIANRIHIELTTRKAAILIDEENDVIEEIYDSWYKLFNIIRDEIKSVPGNYLKNHDPTNALIGLTKKILNDGLRPHLTEHQAKFRAWLLEAKKKQQYNNYTPQELQKEYPNYKELVTSMKEVNFTLRNFAAELEKLIKCD